LFANDIHEFNRVLQRARLRYSWNGIRILPFEKVISKKF